MSKREGTTFEGKVRVAVALDYDTRSAPRVAATGSGLLAERIIALAAEHDVPIKADGDLAAVLSTLELGSEIPETLYRAVAEVIAFAWIIKGRLHDPPAGATPATPSGDAPAPAPAGSGARPPDPPPPGTSGTSP